MQQRSWLARPDGLKDICQEVMVCVKRVLSFDESVESRSIVHVLFGLMEPFFCYNKLHDGFDNQSNSSMSINESMTIFA